MFMEFLVFLLFICKDNYLQSCIWLLYFIINYKSMIGKIYIICVFNLEQTMTLISYLEYDIK